MAQEKNHTSHKINSVPSAPPALPEAELREFQILMNAREQRRKAPKIEVTSRPGKPLEIDMQDIDAVRFLSAFGTAEQGFAFLMLNGIVNAACDQGQPEAGAINKALAAVTGIGARDETEAMLATQMVATHVAAIRALRRLRGSDTHGSLRPVPAVA